MLARQHIAGRGLRASAEARSSSVFAPRAGNIAARQQHRQQHRLAGFPALHVARRSEVSLKATEAVTGEVVDTWKPVQKKLNPEDQLTIGIVGFGLFGQFLAKRMVLAGHRVLATSRSPYEEEAKAMGVEYFRSQDDFCEQHPEVVILVTSILSTDTVLEKLPLMRLKRSTLIVDVLSVKVFPKQLLLAKLPPYFDILCTHPMFGPNSGSGSWKGLNFQYERVRTGSEPARSRRVDKFLKFFADEGCNMVEMTCEDHDYAAASTQFVTHTVGRMLGTMKLKSTKINTKGFEALLNLVSQTNTDSFDLYYGLFLYNQNATDELERLQRGLERVKKSLFSRLHDIARVQMFPDGMVQEKKKEKDGKKRLA